MRRIPQPPINPALRNPEHHVFWPGFIAALAGLILVCCGARHMTGVETVDGGRASEMELIKAYSSSGLQYPEQVAPPAPPKPDAGPEALERWANQSASFTPPTWKVRVDTAAKDPCPT